MAVTAASSSDFATLSGLIARQRRELDRMQSEAASRSVVDLARGMLMERLFCSAAEAQAPLAHLSAESGTSVPELATQITSAAQITGPLPQPGTAEPGMHRVALAGAAMETSCDGAGIASALLEEALAPAGAVAVALWLTEPDGGLVLAGEAGFGARDASRWRRIHPEMRSLAQRAAHDGLESWWSAGRPAGEEGAPPRRGRGAPGAGAVLPLRSDGLTLGAMEICGPEPGEVPAPLRRE